MRILLQLLERCLEPRAKHSRLLLGFSHERLCLLGMGRDFALPEHIQRKADIARLCKPSHLMPRVLDPPGEARPGTWVLRELARRVGLEDFFPWASEEALLDALLDHPSTGHATVAALRAEPDIMKRYLAV